MAYISDVGEGKKRRRRRRRKRERKGEKGTSFKHIRERWCLKNNRARGARNRERGGEIKRRNESEGERGEVGWPGSTAEAINSLGGRYRFSCNYFGITAATMLRYRAAD